MPPKASTGKKAAENKLVVLRKKHAVFAPGLDRKALTDHYQYMWAAETTAHPEALTKELQNERALVQSAALQHNDYVRGMENWTKNLADVARRLAAQLSIMGVEDHRPLDDRAPQSTKLTIFFGHVLGALEQLDSNRAARLASESRKLCQDVLRKVLTKVVFRNPSINLSNVFDRLPKDADLTAAEELVAPIIDRISRVKRVEGDRRD